MTGGIAIDGVWWEYAACRNSDPMIFQYPVSEHGYQLRRSTRCFNEARALCAGCPVLTDCLRDAIDNAPELGGFDMFQAGYTPPQLDEIARRAAKRKVARRG